METITENVLREVNDNGEAVLKDGSKWFVDPHEVHVIFEWPPGSRIRVDLVDEDTDFPYELTDVVHGDSVRALRIEE